MSTDPRVLRLLDELSVRRVIHFTPARNLHRILEAREIQSVAELGEQAQPAFAVTDTSRYDGHPDKVSCSLEYPNVFYLRTARGRPEARSFLDWAYLFLDPVVAAERGTLFSPRNAATGRGALLAPGEDGLRACYADSVAGAWGQVRTRGPRHAAGAPTDIQAEALIPGPIPLCAVQLVVMPTAEQVAEQWGRLERFGLDPRQVEWAVSAGLFNATDVTAAAQSGSVIDLAPYTGGEGGSGA